MVFLQYFPQFSKPFPFLSRKLWALCTMVDETEVKKRCAFRFFYLLVLVWVSVSQTQHEPKSSFDFWIFCGEKWGRNMVIDRALIVQNAEKERKEELLVAAFSLAWWLSCGPQWWYPRYTEGIYSTSVFMRSYQVGPLRHVATQSLTHCRNSFSFTLTWYIYEPVSHLLHLRFPKMFLINVIII